VNPRKGDQPMKIMSILNLFAQHEKKPVQRTMDPQKGESAMNRSLIHNIKNAINVACYKRVVRSQAGAWQPLKIRLFPAMVVMALALSSLPTQAATPIAENQTVLLVSSADPQAISLLAYDADDDPLTYTIVNGPTNGSLSGTAPSVVYTPDVGFTDEDSFTFRVNDGTADSQIATVTIISDIQRKLTASDGAANDVFGYSVSLFGDTVLIGAHHASADSGSAYVFKRVDGVWSEEAKLTASDGAANDHFGHSVSLDGDTALIGAYRDDAGGVNEGAAYVFKRVGGGCS